MASYLKDFEQQPQHKQYLSSYLGGNYNEESFQLHQQQSQQQQQQQEQQMESEGGKGRPLVMKRGGARKQENLFWISVSGYRVEHASLVYRFFVDIGHVVDKIFTESNFMYLKYASLMDCEIALSYNGQKIGYAGDIPVRVRPENPQLDYKLQTVIEEEEEAEDAEEGVEEGVEQTGEQEVGLQLKVIADDDVAHVTQSKLAIRVVEVEQPVKQVKQPLASDGRVSIVAPITAINGRKGGNRGVDRKPGFLQWLKQKVSYMFYYY